MAIHIIEESVVAVAECEREGSRARVTRFLGTAFFVDTTGIFMTAAHVVSHADLANLALCVKPDPVGDPLRNAWAWVRDVEHAPDQIDVAIGKVDFATEPYFALTGDVDGIWQDVHTCGYPEHAIVNDFQMPLKGNKGSIQRVMPRPDEMGITAKGRTYELSFAISKGMSGSPLLTSRTGKLELLGVCIGSATSEIVDYSFMEVDDKGHKYSETKSRFEQVGLATAIATIADWKPRVLGDTVGAFLGLTQQSRF